MRRIVVWIVIVGCVAVAITILGWTHLSKPRRDTNAVAAAQDEVYEAVVGYITAPVRGRSSIGRLVFDETVLAGFGVLSGPMPKTCKEAIHKVLRANDHTPPFNSLADKLYRLFAGTDASLQSDTIADFVEKACTSGRLSQTFHTAQPRSFIPADSVYFEGWPSRNKAAKPLEQLFPGADGIISFSHVGFDSSLHQAIVSTSFVCGGLCGTGRYYVLKKRSGRWQIIGGSIVWVS
jgi:hypothetical protein